MQKQKAKIENWLIVPVLEGEVLIGDVYGHPKLRDGWPIRTSLIVKVDMNKKFVETLNTVYTLGKEYKFNSGTRLAPEVSV